MVYTEGGDFYSSGVKNSLFIAEAYAMGGWALVIVSPIFMAIGVHIRMLMLYTTLRYSFSSPVAKIFSTPLLLLTSSLTGDFSSFALQKGTILLFMIFIPFLIAKNIFGLFSKSTPPT
jgi:hypothetical protein